MGEALSSKAIEIISAVKSAQNIGFQITNRRWGVDSYNYNCQNGPHWKADNSICPLGAVLRDNPVVNTYSKKDDVALYLNESNEYVKGFMECFDDFPVCLINSIQDLDYLRGRRDANQVKDFLEFDS